MGVCMGAAMEGGAHGSSGLEWKGCTKALHWNGVHVCAGPPFFPAVRSCFSSTPSFTLLQEKLERMRASATTVADRPAAATTGRPTTSYAPPTAQEAPPQPQASKRRSM